MRTHKSDIIGIDIGGSKIRAILWDGKRIKVSYEKKIPLNKSEFIKILHEITNKFLQKSHRVSKIGVGSAGVINKNTIVFSPNIPYLKKMDLAGIFPRSLELKVDNDARAFAKGEYLLGAGKKSKNLLVITLGTGIGRAFVKNGKAKKIKRFEYPEKWEKQYQKIRSEKKMKLAIFIAQHLLPIIKYYKPDTIIFGGGVIEKGKKSFFVKLKTELIKRGVKCKTKKSALRENGAVIGAALLFKN